MLTKLNELKVKFEKTSLWKDMENTVEGSPWHREANVAVHTNMAIDYFIENFAEYRNDLELTIVFLSLLFHDTGKPAAREECYSEKRGNYLRFAGHEQISARVWEDYYCDNETEFIDLGVNRYTAFKIGWIIQNHLPYDVKKPTKRIAFATSLNTLFDNLNGISVDCFYDHLLSDCNGRISDEHNEKRRNLDNWISEHKLLETPNRAKIDCSKPNMYILIGASGTGKSSYVKKYLADELYHSMDQIRLDLYERVKTHDDDIYENAFQYSIGDGKKEFSKARMSDYFDKLSTGKPIVVDNTNTSKKSRAFYCNEASQKGYRVIAILFPISRSELIERQLNRTDKKISTEVSLGQYARISLPNVGSEVDDFIVVR